MPFNLLERAVLDAFCRKLGDDDRTVLDKQLKQATVSRRENSGAGFFTYFEADHTATRIKKSEQVLSGVAAEIASFANPVLFMLFVREGYAEMLEGATIDDRTVDLDFSTVRFKIIGN